MATFEKTWEQPASPTNIGTDTTAVAVKYATLLALKNVLVTGGLTSP